MAEGFWLKEFPSTVTVCDKDGVILEMNDKAAEMFEKDGGRHLIGSNLLDCHPEPSRTQLLDMLKEGTSNTYTVTKNGKRKLIHQSPWFEQGTFAGLVEIHVELPDDLPHYIRDNNGLLS